MSTAADTRKLTPRGRDRRQSLLDFATRRFAENGYHPTSVADIVDGVGVGKGVFYWYFPSKDDLLREILRESIYDLRKTQQAAIDGVDSPLAKLEAGVRASMAWSITHPDILRLVAFAWTEQTFAEALRKGDQILLADTAKHLRAAIEAGDIEPGDPELLAIAVNGVTRQLSSPDTGTNTANGVTVIDEAQIQERIELGVRVVLHGIRG